jgi:hypothetical protein
MSFSDKVGGGMSIKGFRKGPKLFSLARKKALMFDIPQEKGVKLAELICRIQEKEGNQSCFRQREICSEDACCWQASCGVRIIVD